MLLLPRAGERFLHGVGAVLIVVQDGVAHMVHQPLAAHGFRLKRYGIHTIAPFVRQKGNRLRAFRR